MTRRSHIFFATFLATLVSLATVIPALGWFSDTNQKTLTGSPGLKAVLDHNLVEPLSLASGDFDEDGVPEIVSGYAGPSGGILAVYRDHAASPARIVQAPDAPDFLAVGDFNNDGHADLAGAASGSDSLFFLLGDGRGDFEKARRLELPGAVTALIAGEMNRADGLMDLVVGVAGMSGPHVLLFAGSNGVLDAQPETVPLPAEATALALGHLDDDYPLDLAVAAGSELVIVYGHDFMPGTGALERSVGEQLSFSFAITSLAVGDFIADSERRMEIAVLSEEGRVYLMSPGGGDAVAGAHRGAPLQEARTVGAPVSGRLHSGTKLVRAKVTSRPTDDLVVMDRASHQLHILTTDDGQTQSETRNPKS
jgi:hypothetical protein